VPTSRLPRELMPITTGVFAQMLGEGIAYSSLPLYLTRLGATPTSVGLAISSFSLAQMTFVPVLVGLSSRIGRSEVLRICLLGAVASSLLIAFSGSVSGIVAGRTLAGAFAACLPVAQSGAMDVLGKERAALGLSRVAAASQLGVVVGPAFSAVFQAGFAAVGVPASRCLPAVYCLSSLLTLAVAAQMTIVNRRFAGSKKQQRQSPPRQPGERHEENQNPGPEPVTGTEPPEATAPAAPAPAPAPATTTAETDGVDDDAPVRFAQPMLRTTTIAIGWIAILSNSIYGLFAPRFLGFSQPQLSATCSFAAALVVGTQFVFPKLVSRLGTHTVCALGILAAGVGIGGQSLVRVQPLHSLLYMSNRVGAALADTSTAALVVSSSPPSRKTRARNLALLASTRAAGKVVSPLLSSKMFELGCRGSGVLAPGSLPFVAAACLAVAVAPLPVVLGVLQKRATQRRRGNEALRDGC